MLSYLEVWNNRIRMKQRVKINNSQFKEKETLGAACTAQPLKRVSDALASVGTSGASDKVFLSLYKAATRAHLGTCLQL